MPFKILDLEKLRAGISGIDSDFGAYTSGCAVFCLTHQGHESGVILEVKDIENKVIETFKIIWEKELTENSRQSYQDKKDTANHAGMALAILLILQLTDYDDFRRTESNGVGVDFMLKKVSDDFDFESSARLEVSAILATTPKNTLRTRLNIKIEQSKKSDYMGTDACVIVSDFKKPETFYHLRLV